jgi:ferritin
MNQMVFTEASITLNDIVFDYMKEFGLLPRVRELYEPKTKAEKRGEDLIESSYIEEPDYGSVIKACRKTVMKLEDFENEVVTSDLSEQRDRRRKIEEIISIMHISRTYPENAIKRLKRLRPQTEKASGTEK